MFIKYIICPLEYNIILEENIIDIVNINNKQIIIFNGGTHQNIINKYNIIDCIAATSDIINNNLFIDINDINNKIINFIISLYCYDEYNEIFVNSKPVVI